jgi:hypothetical protein
MRDKVDIINEEMNKFYYFLLSINSKHNSSSKKSEFLLLKKSATIHTLIYDGNIYCNPLQFKNS